MPLDWHGRGPNPRPPDYEANTLSTRPRSRSGYCAVCVCVSACLLVCLSFFLSLGLSVSRSVYISVCLYLCISLSLSVQFDLIVSHGQLHVRNVILNDDYTWITAYRLMVRVLCAGIAADRSAIIDLSCMSYWFVAWSGGR